MKIAILALFAHTTLVNAAIPPVAESVSPDGKIHVVLDVDRDPKISPEWKGESFPQIEITEKVTGRVLASISYFGAAGDDTRPLREHVRVSWRSDSKAFGVTIDDRFYTACKVFALSKESKFVEVALPSYEAMTGHPVPDNGKLIPRGRASVEGWDADGRLIYSIFMSPLPTFSDVDPIKHKVLLEVSPSGMTIAKKAPAEQVAPRNR